ncbi:MAG: magnesium transporter [Ignavibacteriae bacterium]|nr:magnesium transporter [Ignavibacteria bacterium]MBI3364292.1 magnesium transporter [Ignavibacteriota bacterium]
MTEAARNIQHTVHTEDAIIVPRKRGVKTIEVDEELMQDIRELVHDRATPILKNILTDLHEADIGEIINHLEHEDRLYVFDLLDVPTGSVVLLELDSTIREQLLDALPSEKITAYVDRLASDDAADLVAELQPHVAEKVLRAMPTEDSADVKNLMRYAEDTAGGIMGTELVAVKMGNTLKQAIGEVRAAAKENMVIDTVYVIDDKGVLVGSLPLQTLVLHSPNRRVYKVMDADVKSIRTDVDQEEAAAMFRKYDLVSLPVVDTEGCLVGRITIDDIVDVIEEEHSEDVARLVGSDAEELERRSPYQIAILRLPWVLTTLAIEFLAGVVIHHFDETLSRVILLASFMPIISAISGNTGLQSAAIIVRAMSTGHVTLDRWWTPLARQVQTTLIIGSVCGIVLGMVGSIWQGKWEFGLVVGFSMFISVNISGIVGTTTPMISKKLGFDPALTAGPFETAFQDVVGISIFLSLATSLLHWIA